MSIIDTRGIQGTFWAHEFLRGADDLPPDNDQRQHGVDAFRLVLTEDNPWWVARDVCAVAGIAKCGDAFKHLDNDERSFQSIVTNGGPQRMLCVNESGLHTLASVSRHPQRRVFQQWLREVVAPIVQRRDYRQLHLLHPPQLGAIRRRDTDGPHVLYRMFDRSERLLYVGITLNPPGRFRGHQGEKAWWDQVATVTLEQHENRRALEIAETNAIIAERPLHNIVHNEAVR